MNINSRNIYIVYILLYFSLLIGFYFNEDFSLGYINDYYGGKEYVSFFENSIRSLSYLITYLNEYGVNC